MKRYFSAMAALAMLANAGCGAALPTVAATAQRIETAAARPVSPVGSIFRYAGSMTSWDGGSPVRTNLAQTVTVTATPYPYASHAGAVDDHGVETDRSNGASSVWTSDAWRGLGAAIAGVAPYLSYGSRTADASGDSYLYRYPVPQTVDQQPERNGATWSNGGAMLYRERDADGTIANATFAASGAYTETVQYATACAYAACRLQATVAASGAARYSGSALVGDGIDAIALGAPHDGAILVTYTYPGGYRQSVSVPAWFAAGAPLYAESDSIRTGVVFPKSCSVPATFGTTGNLVVRVVSQIDPAAGTSQSEQVRTYVLAPYGAVCSQVTETTLEYYDFADAQFSGTPLQRSTVTETIALQSAAVGRRRAVEEHLATSEMRWTGRTRAALHRAFGALGAGARGPERLRQNPPGG